MLTRVWSPLVFINYENIRKLFNLIRTYLERVTFFEFYARLFNEGLTAFSPPKVTGIVSTDGKFVLVPK